MGLEPKLGQRADLSVEEWKRSLRWWGRFYFHLQLLTSCLLCHRINILPLVAVWFVMPAFKASVSSLPINVEFAYATCLANELWVNPDTCHIRAEALNVSAYFDPVFCQQYRVSQIVAPSWAWDQEQSVVIHWDSWGVVCYCSTAADQ